MHGSQSDCGIWNLEWYCGPAGEYFDFRYNTMYYSAGDGIKVRGYPLLGADIAHNVLFLAPDRAIVQTDGDNLNVWDNVMGGLPEGSSESAYCDFDGDGQADEFKATGVAWWYKSAATGQWRYLGTSQKFVSDLRFADVNSDGYCDVQVDENGTVYLGPSGLVGQFTKVATARNADGRMETFGITSAGRGFHRRQAEAGSDLTPDNDILTPWVEFGGLLRSIAAETNADGRIEVVGVNSEQMVWRRTQAAPNSTTYGPWILLDGLLDSIALARNADGRLEIVGTNSIHQVFHKWQTTPGSNSWSAWAQFDGMLRSVAAETNPDGSIEVVGANAVGNVYHRRQLTGGGWSGWQLLR